MVGKLSWTSNFVWNTPANQAAIRPCRRSQQNTRTHICCFCVTSGRQRDWKTIVPRSGSGLRIGKANVNTIFLREAKVSSSLDMGGRPLRRRLHLPVTFDYTCLCSPFDVCPTQYLVQRRESPLKRSWLFPPRQIAVWVSPERVQSV